jgi:hypothetical protein
LDAVLQNWAQQASLSVVVANLSQVHWQANPPPGPLTGVLLGHVGFGYSPDVRQDAVKIAVLRDPLERCISYFDFSR